MPCWPAGSLMTGPRADRLALTSQSVTRAAAGPAADNAACAWLTWLARKRNTCSRTPHGRVALAEQDRASCEAPDGVSCGQATEPGAGQLRQHRDPGQFARSDAPGRYAAVHHPSITRYGGSRMRRLPYRS